MRLFWGLIGVFVVGCGSRPPVTDGADSGSTADSGSVVVDSGNQETGDTEETIVPEQGYYLGSVTGEVVNECGLDGMDDASACCAFSLCAQPVCRRRVPAPSASLHHIAYSSATVL